MQNEETNKDKITPRENGLLAANDDLKKIIKMLLLKIKDNTRPDIDARAVGLFINTLSPREMHKAIQDTFSDVPTLEDWLTLDDPLRIFAHAIERALILKAAAA
jgi:hypothetical protein